MSLPQTAAAISLSDPLVGADQAIATWFHAHLTRPLIYLLRVFSELGSAEWIGFVLFFAVCFFIWKRTWPALATLIVAVPGGMLLNELVKIMVHRHRPFLEGAFVDWSGYSFASGHTVGATLLYGQLALFLLPMIKSKSRQRLIVTIAAGLVVLVGFSRIALGAHYLSDVLAAMFFGIIWLALCGIARKPMRPRQLQLSLAAVNTPNAGQIPVAVPVEHDTVVAANS